MSKNERILVDNRFIDIYAPSEAEAPSITIGKLLKENNKLKTEIINCLNSTMSNIGEHFKSINDIGNYALKMKNRVESLEAKLPEPLDKEPKKEYGFEDLKNKKQLMSFIKDKGLAVDISSMRFVPKMKDLISKEMKLLESTAAVL